MSFGDIAVFVAILINIAAAVMSVLSRRMLRSSERDYRSAQQRLEEHTVMLRERGLSPEAVTYIYREMTAKVGLDLDLCERILNDLAFMHDQLYGVTSEKQAHTCPVCESTAPELTAIAEALRNMRIGVSTGGCDESGK